MSPAVVRLSSCQILFVLFTNSPLLPGTEDRPVSLSLTQCPHWSKRTFDSLVPADVLLSLLSIDWQIASC